MNSTGQSLIEAEQSVIGSILIDNKVADQVVPTLEPRDFAVNTHQIIWTGIQYLYKHDKPIDTVTLAEMLVRYKRLDDAGGMAYIGGLINSTPTASNAKEYARIVRSDAYRRRGIEAGEKIRQLSESGNFTDDSYFAQVEKVALSLRPKTTGNMQHVKDSREEYMRFLETKDDLINTGFPKVDEWMGGVARGDLYIVAARPSVGKTAKALQMARSIAAQNVGEVLIWSQEMTRNKLFNRMIPSITGINANLLRKKQIDSKDKKAIAAAWDDLEKLPLHIDDASGVRMEDIRATAREIKRSHGRIAAIIVDYLQIMNITQDSGMNRAQAVGQVTRQAKWLAKELDCVFIMLSQMNRESAKAEKPATHHLRESGEIEQDADIIEFLWMNPEDTDNRGKVVQSVFAKGRDVGVNEFRYLFRGWLQSFEELPGRSGQ